jgi:uncharacterized protein involved in exopolysaccharide biosynthesis
MQPQDSYSVSRRSLDVEDYIDILRRHKGWIFGPFLLCVVVSVVGVFMWPDRYLSTATIRIQPQKVPESMVPAVAQQQMWARIESMKAGILSRATLTTIIQNKNLYPKERAHMPTDDVVEEMGRHIVVQPLVSPGTSREIPAFFIQFSYENRYLAQAVVADLMGKFIDESVRNNSTTTFELSQFFKDEADNAKKQLDEAENKLADFQVHNAGHLPDQADANMRSMMAVESQLNMLNANASRANSDKLQLESALKTQREQLDAISKQAADMPVQQLTPAAAQRNEKLLEAERNVEAIDSNLRILHQRYGDKHPDVQTVEGNLAVAKQKRDELKKEDATQREEAKKEEAAKKDTKVEAPSLARSNPLAYRELLQRRGNIDQLVSQIEAKDLEIQEIAKDIKRANEGIRRYEGQLASGFVGGKAYTDLLRDKEMAKTKYVEADEKLTRAQRNQNMEDRHQGERLEPLDTASLPTDPTEPKRPLVISVGAGIGLILGVVIAGAREMKDTSLKNLKDVRAYTQMAVLGSIPLLENDFVVKRRRRLAWLGWTTACLVAVVVMVGAIVYYESTRGGVQ